MKTTTSVPESFSGVKVLTKANVYFEGNVISHAVEFADGEKKTIGVIRPGSYHFGTGAAERMEIVAGSCRVTLDGAKEAVDYAGGSFFDVPAKSGFGIEVKSGLCEYVCSYLKKN